MHNNYSHFKDEPECEKCKTFDHSNNVQKKDKSIFIYFQASRCAKELTNKIYSTFILLESQINLIEILRGSSASETIFAVKIRTSQGDVFLFYLTDLQFSELVKYDIFKYIDHENNIIS